VGRGHCRQRGGRPNFNPKFSDEFAGYLADVAQHIKEDPVWKSSLMPSLQPTNLLKGERILFFIIFIIFVGLVVLFSKV